MEANKDKETEEIDVTPEMLKAGRPPLMRFHREYGDEDETLRQIFLAMHFAWRGASDG